jgi:hypothetical protein
MEKEREMAKEIVLDYIHSVMEYSDLNVKSIVWVSQCVARYFVISR